MNIEAVLLKSSRGFASRVRLATYRALGMKQGIRNRLEGGGRCRRLSQIEIGSCNAFTQGTWLWPNDADFEGVRIRIGSGNYFNRNVMIDACGYVEIGNDNLFGPDVYITDSNHRHGCELSPKEMSMEVGSVQIGNQCWIGAKAVILKDVQLGDRCVVAAGAVVARSFPGGSIIAGVPARILASSAVALR